MRIDDPLLQPLLQALQRRDPGAVRQAVADGAPVTGWTALSAAIRQSQRLDLGMLAIVEALLEAGAEPDARRAEDGLTALMLACKCDGPAVPAIVAKLLEAGSDCALVDAKGLTAAHWAARMYAPAAALELLLGRPGVVVDDLLDTLGAEPLEKAELLLSRGATPTVDALAHAWWKPKVAMRLLMAGASPVGTTRLGTTPLHHAVAPGTWSAERVELVAALLDRGADPMAVAKRAARDLDVKKGQTPRARVESELRFWAARLLESLLKVAVNRSVVADAALALQPATLEGVFAAGRMLCERFFPERAGRFRSAESQAVLLGEDAVRPMLTTFEACSKAASLLGASTAAPSLAGKWRRHSVEDDGRPVKLEAAFELGGEGSFTAQLGLEKLTGTCIFEGGALRVSVSSYAVKKAELPPPAAIEGDFGFDGEALCITRPSRPLDPDGGLISNWVGSLRTPLRSRGEAPLRFGASAASTPAVILFRFTPPR